MRKKIIILTDSTLKNTLENNHKIPLHYAETWSFWQNKTGIILSWKLCYIAVVNEGRNERTKDHNTFLYKKKNIYI